MGTDRAQTVADFTGSSDEFVVLLLLNGD